MIKLKHKSDQNQSSIGLKVKQINLLKHDVASPPPTNEKYPASNIKSDKNRKILKTHCNNNLEKTRLNHPKTITEYKYKEYKKKTKLLKEKLQKSDNLLKIQRLKTKEKSKYH